jgi:hypothetical protein
VKPWYANNAEDASRKHRLGTIYRATLNQKRVLCRNIEFNRLTGYVLEDFFHGLYKLMKIKIKPNIVPILGYYTKDTAL